MQPEFVVPESLKNITIRIEAHYPSAANQRNQGLDFINQKFEELPDYVVFHDDDLTVPFEYFESLLSTFGLDDSYIGVSGLTLPGQYLKVGLRQQVKYLLQFDSPHGGTVLSNTANIPFKINVMYSPYVQESEWLIGCSAWKFSAIRTSRFEKKFKGQSLGEDVLFSMRNRSKGKLAVKTNLHFHHKQSEIGREGRAAFLESWIRNHYEILCAFPKHEFSYFAFKRTSIIMLLRHFVYSLIWDWKDLKSTLNTFSILYRLKNPKKYTNSQVES